MGSGAGWVIGELLRWGARPEGCDIAAGAVRRLRARFPEVSFFRLELGGEPIPRANGSYRLVTMVDVAYHVVEDARWRAGLGELGRVLEPGGRLVATDALGDRDRSPEAHVRFRSRARWEDAAAAAGLRIAALWPCFRWLSRDRDAFGFTHLADGPRGALEYALELLAPRPAHLRCALLVKPTRA